MHSFDPSTEAGRSLSSEDSLVYGISSRTAKATQGNYASIPLLPSPQKKEKGKTPYLGSILSFYQEGWKRIRTKAKTSKQNKSITKRKKLPKTHSNLFAIPSDSQLKRNPVNNLSLLDSKLHNKTLVRMSGMGTSQVLPRISLAVTASEMKDIECCMEGFSLTLCIWEWVISRKACWKQFLPTLVTVTLAIQWLHFRNL